MGHLKMLVRRLALVLVLMTGVRLVFWLANRASFPKTGFGELAGYFLHGIRFDVSGLFWVNTGLIFFSLLPGFWRKMAGFQWFLRWLWMVPNLILLTLELADVAWFPFNLRRTILTDFYLLGNTAGQLPMFFWENWWLVLLLLGGAILLFRTPPEQRVARKDFCSKHAQSPDPTTMSPCKGLPMFRWNLKQLQLNFRRFFKNSSLIPGRPLQGDSVVEVDDCAFLPACEQRCPIRERNAPLKTNVAAISWAIFILSLPIWLLAARGGWQPRPISPIMAAQFVRDPRLAPLLSNATMNLLNSAQQQFIEEKNWLTDAELDSAFSLEQNLGHAPADFRPLNVVTIAFEGAGSEYLERGWLPFLDSLSKLSISPKRGYANGLRSIQGNAAIVAGMPALMTDPWVFSPYQNTQIGGLAAILSEKGYKTAFFHASNPASMQLDKLASATGFGKSYDRRDFPDQSFYDGRWGIFDRPFYQFFCEKLGAMHTPFYAHFFSMTSHVPFKVEPFYEKKYPSIPPVERSFRYADDALRQFFAAASKEIWFKNTLFVIAADHTGPERAGRFTGFEGKFRIPILFYKAGETEFFSKKGTGSAAGSMPVSSVCQQIDVLPTVLDWLRFSGGFNAFGRSIFQQKKGGPQVAYVFESGIYQIMDGHFLLTFDGEKPLQLFDYQEDTSCTKNILGENKGIADPLEARLKAIIQRHNRAMIRNQIR